VEGVAHSWEKASKRVHYQLQIWTLERLSAQHQSLGDVSWIQKATLQLYRKNVPLLHMSTLVQQVTNAGVGRPGYEATSMVGHFSMEIDQCPHSTFEVCLQLT